MEASTKNIIKTSCSPKNFLLPENFVPEKLLAPENFVPEIFFLRLEK
jgi:hypothetical protein